MTAHNPTTAAGDMAPAERTAGHVSAALVAARLPPWSRALAPWKDTDLSCHTSAVR